jgi:hypothetical protein
MMNNSDGQDIYEYIYNGTNYPNVRKYTAASSQVRSGFTYTFKVHAINFNGIGAGSTTPVPFIICIAPSGLKAPFQAIVTKTTVTLVWAAPASDGGCPILSFSIFRDDGAGGALTEIDAASVNNLPTLRTRTITSYTSSDTGKDFVYLVKATNIIGTVASPEITWTLAAAPD